MLTLIVASTLADCFYSIASHLLAAQQVCELRPIEEATQRHSTDQFAVIAATLTDCELMHAPDFTEEPEWLSIRTAQRKEPARARLEHTGPALHYDPGTRRPAHEAGTPKSARLSS